MLENGDYLNYSIYDSMTLEVIGLVSEIRLLLDKCKNHAEHTGNIGILICNLILQVI